MHCLKLIFLNGSFEDIGIFCEFIWGRVVEFDHYRQSNSKLLIPGCDIKIILGVGYREKNKNRELLLMALTDKTYPDNSNLKTT